MGKAYFYLDKNNQAQGPITWAELQHLSLPNSTLIWEKGMNEWIRLSDINKSTSGKNFFQSWNPLKILLLVYAIVGTLFLTFIGRFFTAFIASIFSYGQPDHIAWIILIIAGIAFIPFLIVKKRQYWVHGVLLVFPWLASMAFTGTYYTAYCHTYGYEDGFSIIRKGGKYGVMNRWGLESVPCKYDYITIVEGNHGFRACRITQYDEQGLCDLNGNIIIPCKWEKLTSWNFENYWYVSDGDTWGLLRKDGSLLLPCVYDEIKPWVSTINDIRIEVKKGDWFGLLDIDGNSILECNYLRTSFNDDHLAKLNKYGYLDSEDNIRGGKWGVINRKGDIVVPCDFNRIRFSGRYILGETDFLTYRYDKEGNLLNIY